jgi:hypothetical protein
MDYETAEVPELSNTPSDWWDNPTLLEPERPGLGGKTSITTAPYQPRTRATRDEKTLATFHDVTYGF